MGCTNPILFACGKDHTQTNLDTLFTSFDRLNKEAIRVESHIAFFATDLHVMFGEIIVPAHVAFRTLVPLFLFLFNIVYKRLLSLTQMGI